MNHSAATQTPTSLAADVETREQLEFSAALNVIAERTRSSAGAERVRARLPLNDLSAIDAELSVVEELASLLRDGDRFISSPIEDIRGSIGRVRVAGSVLDAPELMEIAGAIRAMRVVAGELDRLQDEAPLTSGLLRPLPTESLAAKLEGSFEPDGSVSDNASPELKRARQTVRRARNQLVHFLQSKLRESGSDAAEGNVTVRGGRYVVPVRKDDRSRVSGIVHGESASGATMFVEPSDAVPLGNELQSAESAEKREEIRVLRNLSEAVRDQATELAEGWEMCVAVDDVYARARYAVDVVASRPELASAPAAMTIRGARHPLLLAELETVVPFDLDVDAETRVILISGPNTGGKTVILKGVGLLSALAQSGIIPPVGPQTKLPVFQRIESDIGDHQSISESLSTFSARIQAIRRVLERADHATLVLLDEFGTGTDPAEGAALGAAVLKKLIQLGSFTVATTHLGQLKQLASETESVVNASMQFDPDRLMPTYNFALGVPGRSYGLSMARTLGLPRDVVEMAESLQTDSEQSVDALLADLEQREIELARREQSAATLSQSLAAERDGLDALRSDLEERNTSLKAERKELETEGREAARRYLLQARKRVEDALGAARAATDEREAKTARRLIEEGVRDEADAIDKLEEQARERGWRIVRSGRREPQAVQSDEPVRRRRPKAPATATLTVSSTDRPVVTSTTEIDLRGMTGDEAEDVLLRAIDAAIVDELPSLRIIHGKGTGALRERVGIVLRRDGRIQTFQTAAPQEGGWGVTIAELKI